MRTFIITEAQARKLPWCIGCGGPNVPGGVVCWTCFKRCQKPLKYFTGSFALWQKHQPDLPAETEMIIREALHK